MTTKPTCYRTRHHDDHIHGLDCGHTAVRHENHTDYLHDGHLHRSHEAHVYEHDLAASELNPASCTPHHACGAHDEAHRHTGQCGHEAVRHGDHIDFLVAGHLHHWHGDHCDDHGELAAA